MSAVDAGKRLYQRAIDVVCPRAILFHHVPKCGGTSVARALRRSYLLSQATVKPHESRNALASMQGQRERPTLALHDLREAMLLYLLHDNVRCIAAHVPFSEAAFAEFADRYAFVTILRDPVDRLLSHYRWSQRPGRPASSPETIEEFVARDRERQMGATYVRYFCGDPGAEQFTTAHVDAAIRNLRRLNSVGFLDDLPSFEQKLSTLAGRRLRIGKENVGEAPAVAKTALDGPMNDAVRKACARDREVWDAVQDLRTAAPRLPGGI